MSEQSQWPPQPQPSAYARPRASLITPVASSLAAVLAGAALVISLTSSGPVGPAGQPGPAGPQGPPGPTGQAGAAATTARLGVCWQAPQQVSADGTTQWVTSVSLDPPVLQNGVYVCPQGETFVTIVPQPPVP